MLSRIALSGRLFTNAKSNRLSCLISSVEGYATETSRSSTLRRLKNASFKDSVKEAITAPAGDGGLT